MHNVGLHHIFVIWQLSICSALHILEIFEPIKCNIMMYSTYTYMDKWKIMQKKSDIEWDTMLENLSLRKILWLSNFIFQMPLQVRTGIRCILNFHLPSLHRLRGSDEKQKSRLSMKEEYGSRWPLNSQLIISYFKKINLYFHSRYSVWGFGEMSPRRVALRLKEKWNKCPAPRLL